MESFREPARQALVRRPRSSWRLMRLRGMEAPLAERVRRGVLRPQGSLGRRSMRVLVTGHHGYIGVGAAPARRRRRATRSSGLDTFFYRGCDFGPADELGAGARARRPRRDRRRSGWLRRGRAPRGALERPARRPQFRLDVRDQSRRHSLASPARRRRRESGASSSPPRARCTGRRRATSLARRGRAPPAVDAVCGVEGARRGGAPRAGGRRFAPVSMRNATAYGVSPRLRLDIVLNNLVGVGSHDRRDPSPERRHRLAAARARAGHRARGDRAARRPRDTFRARRSTSARTTRTTVSATSPRSSSDVMPECEVTFAEGAGTDPRSYRVDFGKLRAGVPRPEDRVDGASVARTSSPRRTVRPV